MKSPGRKTRVRNHRQEAAVRRRWGFTLVELLVVIAIIAVLLTILVPALSRAKSQAREALCKSRLRQFALAFTYYADDNGQKLPRQGNTGELLAWLWDGVKRTGPTDVLLHQYLDGQLETFFCPSFNVGGNYSAGQNLLYWYENRDANGEPTVWYWKSRGLGYVTLMSEALPKRWRLDRLGSKVQPMVMDCMKSYDVNQYFDYMVCHWDSKRSRPKGANMAYTDTHVEWHDYTETEPQFGYCVGPTRLYYWYSETSSDWPYPPSALP